VTLNKRGEETLEGPRERLRVRDLLAGARRDECDRGLRDVRHVGAEEHRRAGRDRLQEVVPSDRHEAPAHERRRRERVEPGQLAQRVHDEDVGRPRGRVVARGEPVRGE